MSTKLGVWAVVICSVGVLIRRDFAVQLTWWPGKVWLYRGCGYNQARLYAVVATWANDNINNSRCRASRKTGCLGVINHCWCDYSDECKVYTWSFCSIMGFSTDSAQLVALPASSMAIAESSCASVRLGWSLGSTPYSVLTCITRHNSLRSRKLVWQRVGVNLWESQCWQLQMSVNQDTSR